MRWLIALAGIAAPSVLMAQEHAPTPPIPTPPITEQIDVIAVGGFLGQLDGFCENPGGTYDLEFLKEHAAIAQRCPAADGKLPPTRPTDRVALGGVLGVRTWLREQVAMEPVSTLFVITGNNQIANFGALGEDALTMPQQPERDDSLQRPAMLSETAPPPQTPMSQKSPIVQTQARVARFWDTLATLKPDIVALGTEDFVRSLRAIDSLGPARHRPAQDLASVLTRWIRETSAGNPSAGKPGLPLIASNVAIQVRTGGGQALNRVRARAGLFSTQRFELEDIDADASVGWLEKVKVSHPADTTLSLSLCVEIAGAPVCGPSVHPANGKTSTTLTSAEGTLRPATRYRVEISGPQLAAPVTLAFSTHQALTPHADNPALFTGFPVVARMKDWQSASRTRPGLSWPHAAPLLVVSLVDPGAKKLLGKEAWTWRGTPCPAGADECEIDILPPVETLHALIARVVAATKVKPFIVLVSDLEDAETQAVLDAFPEVRMTVLPPDSGMLGRASRPTSPPDDPDAVRRALSERTVLPGESAVTYSGDLGFSAIVNEAPAAAAMLVRPEWIGETGGRLRAAISYGVRGEWLVEQPTVTVDTIAGAALTWRVGPCTLTSGKPGTCVYYRATWENASYDYGSFDAYEPCTQGDTSDRCTRFREVATLREPFDTATGDLLRRGTKAELAVVPKALLDEDFGAWLNDLLSPSLAPLAPTNFLSRLMLERAIYRSLRFVRASVPGDKLLETLKKAVASDAVGGTACVVGLDASVCQASIDPDKPEEFLVNGRQVDTRLVYGVAMPDSLAEALSLPHGDKEKDSHDAIAVLHEGVLDGDWYVAAASDSLSARLLARGRRTPQTDVIVSALEIGATSLTLGTPAGRDDVLQSLDVDFNSTTPAKTLVMKSDLDVALIDTWWSAVRAVSKVDFNQRTDLSKDPDEVSYKANTWTYGARWDIFKWRPFHREVRPYVGWFNERAIKGPVQYLSASTTLMKTDGFSDTRTASGRSKFLADPLSYQYRAVGADLLVRWKLLRELPVQVDITRFGVQRAWGTLHNVAEGILIDGVDQGAAVFQTFLEHGAKKVLNDYYAAHLDSFNPGLSYRTKSGTQDQNRLQFELDAEPRIVCCGDRTFKINTEFRFRHYDGFEGHADLRLRTAIKTKIAVTLPLFWRFELVPTIDYQRARIVAPTNNIFQSRSYEALVRFPFVLRLGWGWLVR